MTNNIITMKKIIKQATVIGSAMLLLAGCTKNFQDINTNPAGVTGEVFNADFGKIIAPLQNVQKALIHYVNWEYQLQQNLNADIYSGYMMTPTPFNGGTNNSNYFMMDGWNEWVLNIAYDNVMQPLTSDVPEAFASYTGIDFSDVQAMVKTLKVIEMHKCADVFGPVIYTHYGKPNADLSVDFDTQQDAYKAFFSDLDSAALLIAPYANGAKTVGTAFAKADMIFAGDPVKWLQMINTLRLRLALRIVYADAGTARAEGEKALDPAAGGLITDNSGNAFVAYGMSHPIYDIINGWGDIRSGAPLSSYLNGFNDPRITHYMTPANDPAVDGKYIGIRNGVDIDAKARYADYSMPAAKAAAGDYFDNKAGLAKITTASEAFFLKAEAALRGWANAGSAEENYNAGITASFAEWGAGSAGDYLNDASSTEEPYIDPKARVAGQNDVLTGNPNLSTITIKWDNSASMERNLERVITQKWIATYPDGQEAWSEFRRTGYPKLFPVIVNNSGGTISSSAFIRRLPIPSKYQNNNKPAYTKILATLGGPDTGGTKLWWDKK